MSLARFKLDEFDLRVKDEVGLPIATSKIYVHKYVNRIYTMLSTALPANANINHRTVGVAGANRKMAALFFDGVWTPPGADDAPPKEIAVFGGSESELWIPALKTAFALAQCSFDSVHFEQFCEHLSDAAPFEFYKNGIVTSASYISSGLVRRFGVNAVPVFNSAAARDSEYSAGHTETIVAAIENLRVVNDAKLTWKQVVEFRHDTEATIKLRKLRSWLDKDFDGQPISKIEDAIATKLSDYEWSIRKHGIQTVVGTISELLDPKMLSSTAATATGLALVGGEFWAALGATAIIVGKATVSVTQKFVELADRRRGQHSEVAFVHELKKLTK
ncbi:MAG TPA: hypothetical protein VHZ78_05775 [Rhizomicrobium sp.]|nr:hypothetical protein [Rhizomicrobium sp.]